MSIWSMTLNSDIQIIYFLFGFNIKIALTTTVVPPTSYTNCITLQRADKRGGGPERDNCYKIGHRIPTFTVFKFPIAVISAHTAYLFLSAHTQTHTRPHWEFALEEWKSLQDRSVRALKSNSKSTKLGSTSLIQVIHFSILYFLPLNAASC